MQIITFEVPDAIANSYESNTTLMAKEVKRGVVLWEYLNGHLSLSEAGALLDIGYRGFLELLWSKGIPVDSLTDDDIQKQIS